MTPPGARRGWPSARALVGALGGLALALGVTGAAAQEPASPNGDDPAGDQPAASFRAYGELLAHLAAFDRTAEIQDNASLIGLELSTGEELRFFAHAEFGVNLIQGSSFRLGSSTDSGFATFEPEAPNVLGNRLGYLGVAFGRGGQIAIGKQESVHWDVASYTADRFAVFGGEATLAYAGGTDGGDTGTGRANRVVIYRNTLGLVELGGQVQFRTAAPGSFADGYGASVQVRPHDRWTVGGSYTYTVATEGLEDIIRGLEDDAEYLALGVRYDSPWLDVGAIFTAQQNGDFARVLEEETEALDPNLGIVPVVFDGAGTEIYAELTLSRLSVIGGYVDYQPDSDDPLLHPDFHIRYGIAGVQIPLAENGRLYVETRIDASTGPDGADGFSVLAVGFQYTFSVAGAHGP